MSEHRTTAHPQAELAPSWVLGALDASEATEFEAHVDSCTECRDAVREARETVALLAHAAPRVAPPAALRERVLRETRDAAGTARPRVAASARTRTTWLRSRPTRIRSRCTRVRTRRHTCRFTISIWSTWA